MNVNRLIMVPEGDAILALRQFLAAWWQRYQPDALLAPVEINERGEIAVQVIAEPAGLMAVNPFAPLMPDNAAARLYQFALERPDLRLAAILRPCEVRSLVELQKRRQATASAHGVGAPAQGADLNDHVVVIGVDCLGTFPQAEYRRSVEARGVREVTGEVLSDASEGGLRLRQFRTACQICEWSAPQAADITIGTLGVASSRHLLVIARDEASDARLGLGVVAKDLASEYQVSHRETIVGAIADARAGVRKKLLEDLQRNCGLGDLGCLLALFANCTLCGKCIQACPLEAGEFSALLDRRAALRAGRAPLAELVALSHWLASCSGCGMCEQTCENAVPLILLISALSHRIRDEVHYRAGDPAQQLPWVSQFAAN